MRARKFVLLLLLVSFSSGLVFFLSQFYFLPVVCARLASLRFNTAAASPSSSVRLLIDLNCAEMEVIISTFCSTLNRSAPCLPYLSF
ncbi:hypothetical protein BDV12DRAFT_151992 [Aspergillus spectabilis]